MVAGRRQGGKEGEASRTAGEAGDIKDASQQAVRGGQRPELLGVGASERGGEDGGRSQVGAGTVRRPPSAAAFTSGAMARGAPTFCCVARLHIQRGLSLRFFAS